MFIALAVTAFLSFVDRMHSKLLRLLSLRFWKDGDLDT